MINISIDKVREILSNAAGRKIAVIGDVMLDKYYWGSVSRVSPEAPVPIIDLESETFHLGGAANVALNLKTLGLEPLLLGVIGDDSTAYDFVNTCDKYGLISDGLYKDNTRCTTLKTRIIGNNQHIARLDKEEKTPLSAEAADYLLFVIKNNTDIELIVLEDYNKGALPDFFIKMIIDYANINNIPVFVDPKKECFFCYNTATVFKPNKKEVEEALDIEIRSIDDAISAGKLLLNRLNAKNILITLGSEGMLLLESSGKVSSVATKARYIADVSGAGDTVIATLAAAYCGGADIISSASIANYAAGAVCALPGIVPVTQEMIFQSIQRDNQI